MIHEVIRFSNDMVMVFDEKGEQLPMYQGRYEEVKAKILAHAPQSAEFYLGDWPRAGHSVARKDW